MLKSEAILSFEDPQSFIHYSLCVFGLLQRTGIIGRDRMMFTSVPPSCFTGVSSSPDHINPLHMLYSNPSHMLYSNPRHMLYSNPRHMLHWNPGAVIVYPLP